MKFYCANNFKTLDKHATLIVNISNNKLALTVNSSSVIFNIVFSGSISVLQSLGSLSMVCPHQIS